MRATPTIVSLLALVSWTAAAQQVQEQGGQRPGTESSDEALIKNAVSAAPKAVGDKATVIALDAKGEMRTLREGEGGFTCIPDNPTTPGNDPMCVDQNGMEWVQAWMSRQEPPDKVGFGYMLIGGSDASNDDPFATAPKEGEKWIDTGPHVMIFGPAAERMPGYPKSAENPRAPYVMWSGTPYAHLMIPVGEPGELTAEQK